MVLLSAISVQSELHVDAGVGLLVHQSHAYPESHLTILGAGPDRTLLYRDHEDAAPFFRIQDAVRVRVSGIALRGSTSRVR